jgi:hypothetical protein
VPAPWVAAFQTTPANATALISSRLVYWFLVYFAFLAVGVASRWLKAPPIAAQK